MRPDVKLNNISMSGLGWLRESINFPTPQSQSNTIVVPGRNSPIRYTEALGRVSYQPRSFEIILSMLGTREQFNQKVSAVVNPFAGHLVKVVCSEEPGLYAIFRKTVSSGTWEFPEMELQAGRNVVSVTGNGTVTFRYREGCL